MDGGVICLSCFVCLQQSRLYNSLSNLVHDLSQQPGAVHIKYVRGIDCVLVALIALIDMTV
jgi:hypothetical protein